MLSLDFRCKTLPKTQVKQIIPFGCNSSNITEYNYVITLLNVYFIQFVVNIFGVDKKFTQHMLVLRTK